MSRLNWQDCVFVVGAVVYGAAIGWGLATATEHASKRWSRADMAQPYIGREYVCMPVAGVDGGERCIPIEQLSERCK